MAYRYKKFLSLLLSVALINSSIQPLYATYPEHEDEMVRKAGVQARLVMLEEALQNKIKGSAAAIESWTPSFIKSAISKIGSWFESTLKDLPSSYFAKSPFEIDYVHDRAYWLAHFSAAMDEIQENGLGEVSLKERLTQLQDLVFNGTLSPYTYEKGLKELEASAPQQQTLVTTIREEFKSALKYAPGFIDDIFRREASLYIQDLQAGHGNSQEFISFIRYYRGINNALDYKNILTAVRSYLRENKKALNITKKDYDAINVALNNEIDRTSKAEKKSLKANQAFSVAALSVLPYYAQEWDEITKPTNNTLAEPTKDKAIIEDYLDASTKALRKLVHTSAKYVQEHPIQAIMMALAGQVAAAAAFKSFASLQVSKRTDMQTKGQEVPVDEEQITPPTFSLLQHAAKRNIGDEFQINQNTTGSEFVPPSVTALSDGNTFVVWGGAQTGSSDIYGRLFSADGVALSNEFIINQNTTENQISPSVAGLFNGNAFVVWAGDQTGPWDIYGRLFSANGTALSDEFTINQITTKEQFSPSVTALSDGNAFVAWQGDQTGDWDIYGRLFSANGTAFSNEFTINQNTTDYQADPSGTALSDGNAFVAWQGDQTGDLDNYGRIFSSEGTALSNEFTINQNTIGGQPTVTGLSDGNAFVAWAGSQTGDLNIYGRLFSANGTAFSNEFTINQNTTGRQVVPTVTGLSNGNAFVVWAGDQTGDLNIYGRLFSADGIALSNEFTINQITTSDQSFPSIAGLFNNNIFVAWQSYQTGNSAIYGRIVSADGPITTGTSSLTASSSSGTGPLITTQTTSTLTAGSSLASTTGPFLTTSISSITTLSPTTRSTSNFPYPQQSSSNDNEIILPSAIVGGTVIIAAGGTGYYMYTRKKHRSNASVPSLELGSVTEINERTPLLPKEEKQ